MNLRINDSEFENFPVLRSKRFMFRQFEMSDAAFFFSLRSNPLVMEFMDTYSIQTVEEAELKINDMNKDFTEHKGIVWLILDKVSSAKIGYITIWHIVQEHVRAEIGYALDPKYWGKGMMTEACNCVLQYAFESLGLHSVEAVVNEGNLRSIGLLNKLGFVKEAHFRENYLFEGRFLDSIVYSMLETDFKA